jgi:hypothetical protein
MLMIFDVKVRPDLFLAAKDDRLDGADGLSGRLANLAMR